MLVLRLVRTGRRNQPKFRLVAAEQGKKLDGKVVEILGHYEPAAGAKPFVFDKEKVQGWLSKGALPSNTVAKLLNKQGFDLPVHIYAEAKPRKKTRAKTEAANKPSPVASDEAMGNMVEQPTPAAEEVVVETPIEAVMEETAPVAEEVSADAEPTSSFAEATEGPRSLKLRRSGAMVDKPAEAPTEAPSEENKEPAPSSDEDSSGKA